jgi:predicted Zn-dependent peptidase
MKLKETVREDGLRIITVTLPETRKVHVALTARVGSAYDPEEKRGLFHFFEHMAFKGTKRRSITDIQAFTQRHLLEYNATTMPLQTSYYATAVYTKMPLVTDFLADIYLNSTFPREEVDRERGPIILEIASHDDHDGAAAFTELRKILWKENPLRYYGGGTKKGIQAVTREDIVREQNRWHVPGATIALAVGNVEHHAFVKEVNAHIPVKKSSVSFTSWPSEEATIPMKDRVVVTKPKRKKAIVILGLKLPSHLDERTTLMAYGYLNSLLSSGSASRLYREIREKRGLAYAVGGSFSNEASLGRYYYAYVETGKSHIKEVEKLMHTALTTPLTSRDDFEDAKEGLQDLITLGYDTNLSYIADTIYESILEGKPLSKIPHFFDRASKYLRTITLEDVEALRATLFRPEHFVTVSVVPK